MTPPIAMRLPQLGEPTVGAPLVDAQGRAIRYLRLSVTDRCNFRCSYCSPATWGGTSELLTRDELRRLVTIFARAGVTRVRLTGGEPLYRKELPAIAADLAAIEGIRELALTTNGFFLARHARALRDAGVTQVNVSLDSLDPQRFTKLSGGGALGPVLLGLDAAVAVGFPTVKLNVVVVQGENEAEVVPLAEHAWARGVTPRYIECMPFALGQPVATALLLRRFSEAGLPLRPVEERSAAPRGPAALYEDARGRRAGFIGSITQNFCAGCNRVRVGPSGALRACLGGRDEVALAKLLRGGADDAAIDRAIRAALAGKPDGHTFTDAESAGGLLTMMGIGG